MGTIVRGELPAEEFDFDTALHAYKTRGCNTLVVGDLHPEIRTHLCRHHLGAADERRYRLLALTADVAESAANRLPARMSEADGERTRVLVHEGTARSASARSTGASVEDGSRIFSPDGSILAFQRDVLAGIDSLTRSADGLQAAELRVCLDSLAPLLDTYGDAPTMSFVDAVTARVREERGMGHVYLPLPRTHDAVRNLESDFEIVLSVEATDRGYTQTWDLREPDIQKSLALDVR
ncbi:DUF7504 family protein [Halegenticoccus tardaugens]|uniref:DUF7504 family protein n=1 Tax=Halegenticoccus tardaugens TaxID=2071624 RepID=UPI00100ABA14|nr:hypothetical protein [Halegenticoccus tardaugens]